MYYRTFDAPDSTGWTTAKPWAEWLIRQGVYYPVRHDQFGVCNVCWGPTWRRPDGWYWTRCRRCHVRAQNRENVLAALIPISYSTQTGLESMIWRAKNDYRSRWLNLPLAAILARFLNRNLDHIEAVFGHVSKITVVPSHPAARAGWDHLKDLHSKIRKWPQPEWDLDLLTKVNPTAAKERRGHVDPALFRVHDRVDGRRVLLIDDTWTTGGSILSAAAALVSAGAAAPLAVTLGRQFRPSAEISEFVESLTSGEVQDLERCVLDPF